MALIVTITMPSDWADTHLVPDYVEEVSCQLAEGFLSGYAGVETHWILEA